MLITLQSRQLLRMYWVDSLECTVTQSRIISLRTARRTLGWVIVNGIVGSDRVLAELVNPFSVPVPPWDRYMDDFDTEVAAKNYVLTRVRSRISEEVAYSRWAAGDDGGTGRQTRYEPQPSEFVTVSDAW